MKTAAAVARDTAVSWEYSLSPRGMIAAREEALEKAAQAKVKPPPLQPPEKTWQPNYDRAALHKRAIDKTRLNERRLETIRAGVARGFDKAAGTFDDLRTYFAESGHTPFGDVVADISIRFGKRGESVMQKLAEVAPRLTKEAATDNIYMGVSRPAMLVQSLLEELDQHADLQLAYEQEAVKVAAENEELLRPFAHSPSRYILEDSSSEKTGSFAGGVVGSSLKDILGGVANNLAPPSASLENKSLAKLTDPQHEAELRNIRTQAMFQDIVHNDPVLAGYPIEDSMGAFNEISEVAPRAVDQRMIMTPLIRKRLQQGVLDPFEIDQLLGMENKLKKRDQGGMDGISESII